jgi:hypothetical protein
MDTDKRILKTLSVLKDEPLFRSAEAFKADLDAFNHEAYAKAIFQIVTENEPPLSIGLFGSWGIGKSTVVNILFQLVRESAAKKLRPIYFNAWKYSGDSFRRQFLIEVAKQVYEGYPEKEDKVRRLEQLNYTEVLKEEEKKNLLTQLKDVLSLEIRFREAGLARIILAATILIVGAALTLLDHSVYPLLASLLPAVLLFLLKLKFEDVFVVKENPAYDPKLIFPEQFEAEFRKLLGPDGPLGNARGVIAIDDIDRCESGTIRDILTSIKTFLGQENCFFLVPCDDKSIIQVFQDPNQRKGYEDELLRKYFNVGIRMVPLMGTDLVDLASNISRETDIPQSVVQVAILANYRDARKLKHFLNSFSVKHAIAKARHEKGFMPVDVDKNFAGFAKAVLIEDLYPDVFAMMVEHPETYEILERAAVDGGNEAELTRLGLGDCFTKYEGLRAILKKTRDIKIEHVEVFLSLKTTNPEARITRGFELKNAIVQGDEAAIEEIVKGIGTDSAKTSLAALLKDLLGNTTATFLKNTISASLMLYSRDDLLASDDKPQLAHDISYALVRTDDQKALQQHAASALQCAKDAGSTYCQDLAHKYEGELSELTQPIDNIADTVNTLYKFTTTPAALSVILNKQYEGWAAIDRGLSSLSQIQLPSDIAIEDKVPSLAILGKIASAVSPEATEAVVTTNMLRKQVLFKNWDKQLAPIFAERLLAILQQAQPESTYTPRIAFAVESLVENPACIEVEFSAKLWPTIQQLFSRLSASADGFRIHKLVLFFAAVAPDDNVKQAALTFALQNWQSFDDSQLREVLACLAAFDEAPRRTLQQNLIDQELTTLQKEVPNPTERTKQRLTLCFENRQLLAAGSIQTLLVKTLQTQDAAFNVWRPVVAEYGGKLGEEFAHQIAEQCLSLVPGSYDQARRQAFFELFADVLTHVAVQEKTPLLQNYFALCKHADATLRNAAATILSVVRKLVDEHDFKLRLNKLVRDLCDVTPAEILNYRPSLDAALEQNILFDQDAWRDLAALSKRLIQEADHSLQNYGMFLVSRMPKLPDEHEEDLIHLLIGAAEGATAQKESATKVLKGLSLAELGMTSRSAVEEFLKKKENP